MHHLKLPVIEFDTCDCSIIFRGCALQIPAQGDTLTLPTSSSGIPTWCPEKLVLWGVPLLLLFLAPSTLVGCPCFSVASAYLPYAAVSDFPEGLFLCVFTVFFTDFCLTKLPCKQNSENASGLRHLLSSVSSSRRFRLRLLPREAASGVEERTLAPWPCPPCNLESGHRAWSFSPPVGDSSPQR